MDLEHTEQETDIENAAEAIAAIVDEVPPTHRQLLGEAVFSILRWLSEEPVGESLERTEKVMRLKILSAVYILAPGASKYDSLTEISRATGVSIERVRQVTVNAMRRCRVTH
jgi:DNA-directed RNA polymerase sigma subunit (sigma70/sigma32)